MESYWTISTGVACRTGWSCRECRGTIMKGTPVMIRDGRKMRFFYHQDCFSGNSDPRSQPGSSYNEAPEYKGKGK